MKFIRRIRFLLHRDELAEELRVHQQMRADDGLGEAGFGSDLALRERAREAWGWLWLDATAQDIRMALRQMRRAPGMAALAITILALGIGANTALFSVMDATLLHPLPYAGAGRIVGFYGPSPMRMLDPGKPDMRGVQRSWPDHLRTIEQTAFYHRGTLNLAGAGEPMVAKAAEVSPSLFPLLGIMPRGRPFTAQDQGQLFPQVAIVSHVLAQHFGGAAAALGRTILSDGHPMKVVGVMPAAFNFPAGVQVWLPTEWPFRWENDLLVTNSFGLMSVGRLRPGATIAQARQELIAISMHQGVTRKQAVEAVTIQPVRDWLVGDSGPMLWMLLGAVGLVLLIACADVANLQLARAVARQQEIRVRAALGASRARLLRQNLTESLVLAAFGGAAGLAIAGLALPALNLLVPASLTRLAPLGLDGRVLAFTAAAAMASGCIFGLFPSLHAAGTSLHATAERRWLRRARAALVVLEVALALVLLAGAGLLLLSFARLSAVNPGFEPGHVLTARFDLAGPRFQKRGATAQFFKQVRERLAALPAVERAAIGSTLPVWDHGFIGLGIELKGKRGLASGFSILGNVSPGFFRTLGIPLLAGRDFTGADRDGARRVVIVNQAAAQAYWPGKNAVGQELGLPGDPAHPTEWLRVVGLVGNTALDLDQPPQPRIYVPMAQSPAVAAFLVVRSKLAEPALVPAIRSAVARVDANEPMSDIATMQQRMNDSIAAPHFRTLLLGLFAALALLLAAAGIFGAMANWASRRTGEIGIRMALGADQAAVLRLVLRQGLRLLALGIVIGLGAALALGQVLEHFLFQVAPRDPAVLATAAAVMAAAGALACYTPARRAARL
ncbi:MAG: ADOP family duplicated permease, partial [Terriglobales bacterium]